MSMGYDHYLKRNWEQRKYEASTNSVQAVTLIDSNIIFLSNRHIKPGLIKKFVKAFQKKKPFRWNVS